MTMLNLPRRSRHSGFVLLEVIVAMVIMGIAMATMMRSFTLSLAAIRKNDVTTEATILAETALQALEAEPPRDGRSHGSFADDGFPRYGFDVVSDTEKLKYRLKTKTRVNNLRDLKHVKLSVTYDDPRGKVTKPVEAYLVLAPLERFSYESKLKNELFSEEEGV